MNERETWLRDEADRNTDPAISIKLLAVADEIRRLEAREEIGIVAFLARPDVVVGTTCTSLVFVRASDWSFEGTADNVVSAARMAMHDEAESIRLIEGNGQHVAAKQAVPD